MHWILTLACMTGAAIALPVAAQVPSEALPQIDPGLQQERTLRDEDYYRNPEAREQGPVIEPLPRPDGAALPENGTRFQLESVRFTPSAFIDAAQLAKIGADYERREISFAEVNELVARVNDIYAEQGIVTARAVVPPQRIEEGVLEIRLVEGQLGELVLEGEPYTRRSHILSRLPLQAGEVVDVPALREALTRFNHNSTVSLRAALAAGEQAGESDVRLSVVEPPRLQQQVFADNNGAESTGETRLGTVLTVNGPLRIDDRFSAFVVGSEGALNGVLSYDLPVNRSGGRVSARYTQGDIEIIKGAYNDLNITGKSSEVALRFDQPTLRRDSWALDTYLEAADINSSTDLEGSALSDYDVVQFSLGVVMQGYATHSRWSFHQSAVQAGVEDVFEDESDYVFLEGDASYLRAVSESNTLVARAGWQWSNEKTVPPTLLFQLGGPGSVRGYPAGALAGADGALLSLEGRHQWRAGLQPFAFVDMGVVEDISPSREDMASVGLGLRWQYGRQFSGEIAWGQTLKDILPDQDAGRLHLRFSYNP